MTRRSSLRGERIALRLLLPLLMAWTLGCAKVQRTEQNDSSTNWLRACESNEECGGLECMCGICNVSCDSDEACGDLSPNAQCLVQTTDEAGTCERACVLGCSGDAECGVGRACAEEGQCVDADDTSEGFTQLAVGGRHGCVLDGAGAVRCWGDDGHSAVSDTPEVGAEHFMQIGAGLTHTCGVRVDGSLLCWGSVGFGNGFQVSGPNSDTSTDFIQVAAGTDHTCAVHASGRISCWGTGQEGAVTGPQLDERADFTQVALGSLHTCGLRRDGTITCWGYDQDDCVSLPNTNGRNDLVQIATGANHTCALREDGGISCWGMGQVDGEVSVIDRDQGDDYVQVMASAYQTCGLHEDGRLDCYGENSLGQVSGARRSSDKWHDFVQLSGSLETDDNFLCGLRATGTVKCWGDDSRGQVSGVEMLGL